MAPLPSRRTGSTGSAGSAAALAALLLAAGTTHLMVPRFYEPLIPSGLGSPSAWVIGSGVAELVCGLAVAVPATRRAGALAAAALFVAVFPGNVVMALRSRPGARRLAEHRLVAWGRLPLQVPLVRWALAVAGSAGRVTAS